MGLATITTNVVSGAAVLLNVDGAGTPDAPFVVTNNSLVGPCTPGVQLLCNQGRTPKNETYCEVFNIAYNSSVNRKGEMFPVPSELNITNCP